MIKKYMSRIIVIALILAWTVPALAVVPQGEVNLGMGLEWNADEEKVEMNSTLTGFRLVLEDYVEPSGKAHLSAKGWRDWKTKTGEIALDQVWYSGYAGDVDYTIGKQQVSWGTADGFNPTNYFSRLDTNALFSGDMSGEPIWAGEAIYYGDNWSLTGVVVPFFSPQKIDAQMEEMVQSIDPMMGGLLLEAIKETKKPKGLGKNSEIALRGETQVGNFDLQGSVYMGYEALPGIEVIPALPPVFQGKYRRQYFAGLATSGTVGDVGVWGELTYGGPEKFAEPESPLDMRVPLSVNEKYLQAVVGGDYTLDIGKGLLVQGQYIYQGQGSLFSPYVEPDMEAIGEAIAAGKKYEPELEPAHYVYGRLGYDFTQDISVDMVVLHGLTDQGGLLRPAYNHNLMEGLNLELSAIKTYGEGYLKNIPTQGRIALKYNF